MFRHPPRNSDNSHRYIYLHRLENLFNNRPIELAADVTIPLRRRLFLLKRWRDERIVYLMETFSDADYIHDATLHKLNFLFGKLRITDQTDIYERNRKTTERIRRLRVRIRERYKSGS